MDLHDEIALRSPLGIESDERHVWWTIGGMLADASIILSDSVIHKIFTDFLLFYEHRPLPSCHMRHVTWSWHALHLVMPAPPALTLASDPYLSKHVASPNNNARYERSRPYSSQAYKRIEPCMRCRARPGRMRALASRLL